MKYMIAVPAEKVEDPTEWATGGEPVVPWYPHSPKNMFLGLNSFKPAQYAVVVNNDDDAIDVDELAQKLKEEYPSLPDSMHDNYVLAIARAAREFNQGTMFRIYIEYDKAELRVVGEETSEPYVLWETQPL
jgi:hypothetical protein